MGADLCRLAERTERWNKKTVVTIALLVAALGPVLIVIGKVISAVGTIMTVVLRLPG